jgi:uncharacterized membrane protein YgcG
MANLNALLSRRSLFLAAWVLLLASVFIPAPAGFFPVGTADMSGVNFLGEDLLGGAGGASGRWVIGQVILWGRAGPGTGAALGFWHVAVLTLAFFCNIVFFMCAVLHISPRVSLACRIFLVAAVGIGGSVALFFPVFARLPAYWLWLASLAVLAWAFLAFEGGGGSRFAMSAGRSNAAAGEVPLVVWMWLGFIVFWLTVTYIGVSRSAATARTEAKSAIPTEKTLTNYFNDRTSLITPETAEKINAALAKFETETSNQVAVAIYPRAPLGSIDEFTIATAERSRLGRKGLDNGAILFVFMNERSARLEVGYGLESVLTDVVAHRILDERLKPAFAHGDYAEGLDTTLGAIIGTVQDAYRQDRMPSKLAVLWRQVRVASPKLAQQALPALTALDFVARFVISFFGGAFGTIACYVLREVFRSLYYLGRLARNLAAPQPGGVKIERIGFNALLEKLKLLGFSLEVIIGSAGFALAAIAGVAGVVIVAAGGGFGGAGALVRW